MFPHRQRMHIGAAVLAVAMLIFLHSYNTSAIQPSSIALTATATINISPPAVEVPLGQLPNTCPRGPEPMSVTGRYGPGIGGYPLWVAGFAPPYASLVWLGAGEPMKYGWPFKVGWVAKRTYTGTVRIRGADLANGQPLWFNINQVDSISPILNLSGATTLQFDGWTDFPSYVYIPRAGCYSLEAEWEGGMWRVSFAAGYLDEAQFALTLTPMALTKTPSK